MGEGVGIVQLRHGSAEIWGFSKFPLHSIYQASFPPRPISSLDNIVIGPIELGDPQNMDVSVEMSLLNTSLIISNNM